MTKWFSSMLPTFSNDIPISCLIWHRKNHPMDGRVPSWRQSGSSRTTLEKLHVVWPDETLRLGDRIVRPGPCRYRLDYNKPHKKRDRTVMFNYKLLNWKKSYLFWGCYKPTENWAVYIYIYICIYTYAIYAPWCWYIYKLPATLGRFCSIDGKCYRYIYIYTSYIYIYIYIYIWFMLGWLCSQSISEKKKKNNQWDPSFLCWHCFAGTYECPKAIWML